MATLFESLFQALASPLLELHHGETVVQYPAGDVSSGVTLTGVLVDRSDEARGVGPGAGIDLETPAGKEIIRRIVLSVPDTVTLDDRDRWKVDNQAWSTERELGHNGKRIEVQVMRKVSISTKRSRLQR